MSWTTPSPLNRSESSVLDLTRACISKFEVMSGPEASKHDRVLENRMADFKLWADGVGAMAKPGASLDSRLKKRPNDLDLVKSILVMLEGFLDEYAGLVEAENSTEEAICNIDSAMTNLAMIGVAVRRTGKASRSRRADRLFDSTKHVEFRRHLECIILLRPSEEGRHPDDLDVSQLDAMQNRLIEANLRRRHRFLLAQSRCSNSKDSQMKQLSPAAPSADDSLPKSCPQTIGESKTNLLTSTPSFKDKERAPPTITGFSTASTAEGTLQYMPANQYTPEPAKTQITLISSNAEFPEPPKLSSDRLICKCPCCCQSIPFEEFTIPEKWRQHLIEDICPYTCIAENCPTPHLFFGTKREWELHVEKDHPTQWQCPLCDEQDLLFPSMESIVDHFQENHTEELSNHSVSTLLSWSAVQCMGIKSCPLCSSYGPQDSPELIDHVLRHSYEFSLRALPWPGPIVHDLNKPIGTYNLPEERGAAGRLGRWIREVDSGPSELLEISKFDTNSHSVPSATDSTDYTDYFAENDYFGDQSGEGTSQRLEVQSGSSFNVSQSLEDELVPPSDSIGLTVLYEGAEIPDVDVVAVHGLSGDAYSTWASGNTIWLRDLLPFLPGYEKARIMTFGYDVRLFLRHFEKSQVEQTLATAKYLLNILEDTRISAQKRPLIFIGHSFGGFVIKRALVYANAHRRQHEGILESPKSIVFFGTPHEDLDFAGWAGVFEPVANYVGIHIAEAINEPRRWAHPSRELSTSYNKLASGFPTITFFEHQKTSKVIVNRETVPYIKVRRVYKLEGDHVSICKFAVEDENWILVSEIMQAIKRTIAKELEVNTETISSVKARPNYDPWPEPPPRRQAESSN